MKRLESKVKVVVRALSAFAVMAAVSLMMPATATGQISQEETILTKGLIFSQTSGAAPVQASQNAALLEANIPGLGGPSGPLGASASLTLPGGSVINVPYDGGDFVFFFSATNNTPAGLDAAYPAGKYSLAVNSKFLSAVNVANLPADNFPAAPHFANYAAAQQVDPTQDFNLDFGAFAGAADPDDATIEIFSSTGAPILSDSVQLGATNYTISQNTLNNGQTYFVHLRFRQLVVTDSSPFNGAAGFYSETVMSLTTIGGQSGNTTPPTLTNSIPSAGGTITATAPFVLRFDEPMDKTKIAIQWGETINGTSVPLSPGTFTYLWSDAQTLVCIYGGVGASWPGGALFSWMLNPVSSGSTNFANTSGIPLASGTYSGNFITPDGPEDCAAQLSDPIEAPAFYLIKAANYTQAAESAPVPDATLQDQFQAFFEMPDNGSVSSPPLMIVVPPPSGVGAPGGLVLTENESSADFLAGRYRFAGSSSANGTGALDAAFPAGDYTLEMAVLNTTDPQSTPVPTNSVTLSMAAGEYPPIPQLVSSKVIPLDTASEGLTVSWSSWAGAISNSFISIKILDPSGNLVFSAPNACSNLLLPASSSSIAIPANTLSNNVAYQIVLSFLSLSDSSKYLTNIPGAGYAALASVTRMDLLSYMSPPPAIAISSPSQGDFIPSGVVAVQVTASQPNGFLTGLKLFSGTNLIGSLPIAAGTTNFSGTISGSVSPGPQNLSVIATDNNGQTATAGPVAVMVQSPGFVVTLSSPLEGATYPPFPTIPLVASASSPSGAISQMDFFMDGNLVESLTSPPFTVSVPQVYPGAHQFSVHALDAVGFGGASAPVSVVVAGPAINSLAAFISTNGSFSFGFTGKAASGYVLEAATSLAPPVDWVPIQTKLLSSAQGIFSDASYGQFDNRYYRVSPINASVSNAPAFSVWGLTQPDLSASATCQMADGALVTLTNSNGTIFNLTLLPGAMGVDQPITMTAVTNIEDYPFAGPVVAAVDLAPEEVDLFVPATLVIQLPPKISAAQVAAFTYHVPNGELYLTPFTVTNVVAGGATNPAISITVSRLGGYGLALLTGADLSLAARFAPSDTADSLDQSTALLLLATPSPLAERPVKADGPSGPSQALVQQFLDQFDTVYASMQAAEASGDLTPAEVNLWNSWLQDVQAAGLEDSFSIQIMEFAQAAANIYQVYITKLILKADSQHDWNSIIHLILIDLSGKLNNPILLAAWQPGQLQALQQALDDCLTFEFDLDTLIENDNDLGTETSHLKAQVTFSEGNPSTKGKLKGQAKVQWLATEFPSVPYCDAVTASPSTPNFLMYGFNPAGPPATKNANGFTIYTVNGLEVIFWPNFPEENFMTTCKGYPVNLANYWWPEFGVLYKDDLKGYPTHGAVPNISFTVFDQTWQIGSGGGDPTLATRQSSQEYPLKSALIEETSTWTLKHTPQ